MANEHLSRSSKRINKTAWWYEEVEGINVVHETRDNNDVWISTTQLKIPWAQIRKALDRKDK